MTASTTTPQSHHFTGKHMLLVMIVFFGVIIAVNFTMAYLASSSWTGLVVKNTYVASQQYNEKLEAAEAQKALGLSSTLSYHQNQLILTIKNKEKEAIAIADLVLEIGRPAFEQEDQELHFLAGPNGSQKVAIHLKPGLWALTISGTVSGVPYRRDARLFVDTENRGVIE